MEEVTSSVGDRLREERTRLDLKQEDLALVGGKNRNTQGSYERGTRNPDTAYLAAVAGLGVDVLYVVTGTRTPVPIVDLSEDDEQLLKRYHSITPDDQKAVRRFLKAMADDAARDRN
ncbi:helix-turn-helix domain-containing protein [Pseudomonas fluorescens]|uniref:helix-turn-helix domain-containing protein n=1 Tax=Pseudomonas fluorescens TaxID=294 RepID=UPI00123F327D|nr:helix-turn-helix transcriptional regulator [Pseudomonas fluorescens]